MVILKSYGVYKLTDTKKVSYFIEKRAKQEFLLVENRVCTLLTAQESRVLKCKFTKIGDVYSILGIFVDYSSEAKNKYLMFVTNCSPVGRMADIDFHKITGVSMAPLIELNETQNANVKFEIVSPTTSSSSVPNSLVEVTKMLSMGTFYFATKSDLFVDISVNLQAKIEDAITSRHQFIWNKGMINPFIVSLSRIDEWISPIICGSIELRTIKLENELDPIQNTFDSNANLTIAVISRLSNARVGTRFQARGINDDGNVANFVETEQILYYDKKFCSFIQIRGTVPLFWEQSGIQVGSHKIHLTRGSNTSKPAFERHFTSLTKDYGLILCVNLLSQKIGESILSNSYQDRLHDSIFCDKIKMIVFDYHMNCTGSSGRPQNVMFLLKKLVPFLVDSGVFLCTDSKSMYSGNVVYSQNGALRVNCIDCLDRTNAVQTTIATEMLPSMLVCLGVENASNSFKSKLSEYTKQCWFNNGNNCSLNYAGTYAIESAKNTVYSKLRDGAVSVKRTIKNNFLDSSRNDALNMIKTAAFPVILKSHPTITNVRFPFQFQMSSMINDETMNNLVKLSSEYTSKKNFRIAVATWNVNGGLESKAGTGLNPRDVFHNDSLCDWLLDCPNKFKDGRIDNSAFFDSQPDIYAVGFEEIVDLTASNIIAAGNEQLKIWGPALSKYLSRNSNYSLVTAEQLVGIALFVFARSQLLPLIRDVAVSTVKTGLGGKTGNKGAVGVSLAIDSTYMCFVCSHLAAGQSSTVQRNQDYLDICQQISFPKVANLFDHHYVFWCGDLNYRLALDGDKVRDLVQKSSYCELLPYDQLKASISLKKVFHNFYEGPINFPPTYKYDLMTDRYDTSEKDRIPSWTDRVLWWRKFTSSDGNTTNVWNPGNIIYYGRADIRTSDHRPVIALIDIEVTLTDEHRFADAYATASKMTGPVNRTLVIKAYENSSTSSKDGTVDFTKISGIIDDFIEDILLIRVFDDRMLVTVGASSTCLTVPPLVTLAGQTVSILLLDSRTVSDYDGELIAEIKRTTFSDYRRKTLLKKQESISHNLIDIHIDTDSTNDVYVEMVDESNKHSVKISSEFDLLGDDYQDSDMNMVDESYCGGDKLIADKTNSQASNPMFSPNSQKPTRPKAYLSDNNLYKKN